MRFVDGPGLEPHRCAVTFRGKSEEQGRWIDTGMTLPGYDPHVYLSETAAGSIAAFAGWTSPDDREALDATVDQLLREKADLELQLREADRRLDAIDVFESAGFRARKKTGRPPKAQGGPVRD